MLSTPFIIEWPDELEEFPFASKTSLISHEILKMEVDKKISRYALLWDVIEIIWSLLLWVVLKFDTS
jgi:hypothetical protein